MQNMSDAEYNNFLKYLSGKKNPGTILARLFTDLAKNPEIDPSMLWDIFKKMEKGKVSIYDQREKGKKDSWNRHKQRTRDQFKDSSKASDAPVNRKNAKIENEFKPDLIEAINEIVARGSFEKTAWIGRALTHAVYKVAPDIAEKNELDPANYCELPTLTKNIVTKKNPCRQPKKKIGAWINRELNRAINEVVNRFWGEKRGAKTAWMTAALLDAVRIESPELHEKIGCNPKAQLTPDLQ